MAKELAIAINFTSKGEQKVIKNLQELEIELAKLQTDLKSLDFGTPAFVEATKNINKLKSQIKDIDKATEGLEAAQKFSKVGEAISLVASSFQILSGILGLFITNTEDLESVQRAEAKALQVLNVVLGIQTIVFQQATLAAEGYSIKSLAASASQYVLSTATKIGTTIQLAFNAALKANPIALVVAGVVALTAVIYGLVKAYNSFFGEAAKTKEILENQNKLEIDLIKTRIDASKQLENQLTILTDNVSTRALELRTIEQLKKEYAGFNAFIDENNKLTEEGIAFLRLQIQLRQDEAALTAISTQRTEKEIQFETEAQKIRNEYGASAKILIKELRQQYDTDLTAINNLQNKYTKSINSTLTSLTPYNKKLEERAKAEAKTNVVVKESIRETEKQNKVISERLSLLTKTADALSKNLLAELKLNDNGLEKQNEIIQKQNDLLQDRANVLDLNKEILDNLNKLFLEVIPAEDEILDREISLRRFFDTLRSGIINNKITIEETFSFDKLLEFAEKDIPNISKLLADLPEESKKQFTEFFSSIDNRANQLRTGLEQAGIAIFKDTQTAARNLLNIEQGIFNVLVEQKELGASEIDKEIAVSKFVKEQLFIERQQKTITAQILATKAAILINEKLGTEEAEQVVADQKESVKLYEQQLAILDKIVLDVIANTKNSIDFRNELVKTQNEGLKNLEIINQQGQAIKSAFNPDQLREYFSNLGEDTEFVLKTLVFNLQTYLERFGEEGTKAIMEGVVQGLKEQGKLTRQEVEKTIDTLQKASFAIKVAFGGTGKLFTEQIEYLKSLLGSLPNELTPLQKGFQNINEIAQKILSAFSDISGQLQQVVQANTSLLLEQLAQDEALAIATIGDASARARELQAQEQKKFAQQRFQIEKKARIQELQFSLANALVDSAGAIINALATIPPPASLIYATLLAGVTGAQVQAIQNQLTFVQSKQFVGRRGGLITGQSHEGSNGGVPAMLEGGEFVVNREAVRRFGDTISDLNSATGGRRLAIDDSRLVQAISSQNSSSTPLKAYVLYNSIQDTQKLNKKITQLARL